MPLAITRQYLTPFHSRTLSWQENQRARSHPERAMASRGQASHDDRVAPFKGRGEMDASVINGNARNGRAPRNGWKAMPAREGQIVKLAGWNQHSPLAVTTGTKRPDVFVAVSGTSTCTGVILMATRPTNPRPELRAYHVFAPTNELAPLQMGRDIDKMRSRGNTVVALACGGDPGSATSVSMSTRVMGMLREKDVPLVLDDTMQDPREVGGRGGQFPTIAARIRADQGFDHGNRIDVLPRR